MLATKPVRRFWIPACAGMTDGDDEAYGPGRAE